MAAGVIIVAPRLHRVLERRADVDFAHPKPPEVQLAALLLVRDRPGVTVRELATELLLKPNNASTLVTAMTAVGLLRKEADERDRRVVHLFLTAQAQDRTAQARRLFTGYAEQALRALPPEQQAAIAAALPALSALVREIGAAAR